MDWFSLLAKGAVFGLLAGVALLAFRGWFVRLIADGVAAGLRRAELERELALFGFPPDTVEDPVMMKEFEAKRAQARAAR